VLVEVVEVVVVVGAAVVVLLLVVDVVVAAAVVVLLDVVDVVVVPPQSGAVAWQATDTVCPRYSLPVIAGGQPQLHPGVLQPAPGIVVQTVPLNSYWQTSPLQSGCVVVVEVVDPPEVVVLLLVDDVLEVLLLVVDVVVASSQSTIETVRDPGSSPNAPETNVNSPPDAQFQLSQR
jgi:hypothetical protein